MNANGLTNASSININVEGELSVSFTKKKINLPMFF
jgi:hypothetical protein